MTTLLRTSLLAMLAALLAVPPAPAVPAKPLGAVIHADRATLGPAGARAGTTVFAGDLLATDRGGLLRVRLGSGQVYLVGSSRATVSETSGTPGVDLIGGAVGFAASGATPVVVRSGDVTVRPKTAEATYGRVEKVNDNDYVISSYRGALEVVVDEQVYAVPEATSYRLRLDPQEGAAAPREPEDPTGVGARSAKRRRALLFFLGGATSAAIATFVVLQNLSPQRP